ncbi:LysR substrate-binding domain-containing protein [Actinokineospora globicatena]|uniref:LysR substrate-binding domain-containing protein n=1 Tax=Actinokineospora globicatena TaxID=103729 RepID=UPI002554EC0C|nr:LysR substrate-binding domain-containing protein [Actinokineospora globicatena]
MTGPDPAAPFRLAYAPGVIPSKWSRLWAERSPRVPLELVQVSPAEAADQIRERSVQAALLRLTADRAGLHAIPLYTEVTVVVIPKDHLLAAADEVTPDDLADEVVLHPLDDTLDWAQPPGRPALQRPDTTGDAIELVAAGIGLLVVPQSLARLHHRKDLTYRTITDVPQSQVALSWLEDETTDAIEQLIGIVRGRTVNSTRGRQAEPEPVREPARAAKPQRKPATPAKKPAAPKRGKPRRRS